MPLCFGQRHIAPWLAGLSERYPRLLIELIQTDEFIDPLRESTDLIFRIGALTDSSFHARILVHKNIIWQRLLNILPNTVRLIIRQNLISTNA